MSESAGGEVIVYDARDGEVEVDVRLAGETVWLKQRRMSELFETTPENILMQLQNVLSDNELEEGRDTLALLSRTLRQQALVNDTGAARLDLIHGYA